MSTTAANNAAGDAAGIGRAEKNAGASVALLASQPFLGLN
jgi:hypothetical protein